MHDLSQDDAKDQGEAEVNPIILRGLPANGCVLVPVEIKQEPRHRYYAEWNGRVHRWHRSAAEGLVPQANAND